VGKDFNKADKGRKFEKGGDTMATKTNPGFMAMMAKKKGAKPDALAKHAAKPASKAHAGLKAGGVAKGGCMAKGNGIESKGKTKGKAVTMQKGGKC
jgi:hypothetical protein